MKYVFGYSAYQDSFSRYFDLHKITAFDIASGKEAGYIKISYIPSSTKFAESIIPFLDLKGHIYNYMWDLPGATEDSVLVGCAWSLICAAKNMGYQEQNDTLRLIKSLPVKDGADHIRQHIIPVLEKRLQKEWQHDIWYHVDRPKTDFISVEDDFRGTGLAEQLYYRAAKWMHDSFNLPYRFSTLQGDAAKKVMQRFIDNGLVRTEQYNDYTFNFIDPSKKLWLDEVA